MADIEEYIERISEEGNIEEMKKLSDVLEDTIEIVKDYDYDKYKELEMCLYIMAYGENLTREKAEEIVAKMRPYGRKWSIDETTDIKENYGYDNINAVDFFIVMNSAYNDFRELFGENTETYARYTELFINDEDAKKGKVFIYYMEIPR